MTRKIRAVLRVASLSDADQADADDVAASTPAERFASVERSRRLYFDYGDDPPRLPRVLERETLAEHRVSTDWRARPRVRR